MRFWKRKKGAAAPVTGEKRSASGKRYQVEVKLLAARAKEAGLNRAEVAQLVGGEPALHRQVVSVEISHLASLPTPFCLDENNIAHLSTECL